MSKQLKTELAVLQEAMDRVMEMLRQEERQRRTAAASSIKPVALTLRLDTERYARLNAHAATHTPRQSFQTIIVEALDAYLDAMEWPQ